MIKIHELEVVPVVYPVRKKRGFGDENERLENALAIDLSQVTLPQLVMVHGSSKKSVVFPHKIEDLDEFTTELITYWTVN